MEKPDVPAVVREAATQAGLQIEPLEITYFIGRESLQGLKTGAMGSFAEGIFSYLQRNAVAADIQFGIPMQQVVEMGIQLDL